MRGFHRRSATPRRPRPARWPLLLAALAAAVLVALFVWARRRGGAPGAPGIVVEADSLEAATRRRDWPAVERWASRLVASQPRSFQALYQLADALHNRAGMVTPRLNRPRPALRLSLERIAAEARVLALLDSAARVAPSPDEWARAQLMRGRAYESLGLPLDALECYRAALERAPALEAADQRYRWVRAHLDDPRLPDTLSVETMSRYAP